MKGKKGFQKGNKWIFGKGNTPMNKGIKIFELPKKERDLACKYFRILNKGEVGICLSQWIEENKREGYEYKYKVSRITIYFGDKNLKYRIEDILRRNGIKYFEKKQKNKRQSKFIFVIKLSQKELDPEKRLKEIKKLFKEFYVRKR